MFHKTLADGFFMMAAVAVFAAMVGWAMGDIWLASTQWMLVAIVLLLTAIYVKMSAEDDEKILKERNKNGSSKVKSKHASFKLSE